ncbi:methyltransferase domain-containing protein [bacterium]|nr:methyltransferase domain-containing protein [bacterium]
MVGKGKSLLYRREICRLCDSRDVGRVVELAPVPLAEKYTELESEGDSAVYPIDLYMCGACGHVQLLDVVDSGALWDDYTYRSGQAGLMVDHFQEAADAVVRRHRPDPRRLVIDIGSNDGSLLRPFKQKGYPVLGVDPAKDIARAATESGIETIPSVLTPDLARDIRKRHGPAAVVTAFNVFAHADDMGGMADSIQRLLGPDGVFVFEVQYLLDILDRMLVGTIFHEHMSHHSLKPMARFLDRHGLELIDVERNHIQHGSIVGTAQLKGGPRPVRPAVGELLALEERRKLDRPETVKQFGVRLERMRQVFAGLMTDWDRRGAVAAGYGAARSGPTLIAQFGLKNAIRYILDDHPQKVNKFSPGDRIPVVPTEELYRRTPDYTVILAWVHARKIIGENRRYLEDGGSFVVCCPDVRVVGAGEKLSV